MRESIIERTRCVATVPEPTTLTFAVLGLMGWAVRWGRGLYLKPISVSYQLFLIACRPNGLDGFFLSLAFGGRHAGRVMFESPQWELEKSIRVGFAHPLIGVF